MFHLRDARSNFAGYTTIAWLHDFVAKSTDLTVNIDCSRLRWLDANLAAPLSAVFRLHGKEAGREFRFHNLAPAQRSILCDTGLLKGDRDPQRGTVIPLQHFVGGQSEEFALYSKNHLEGKGIPVMSKELRTRFYEGIDEVFQNAEIHSESVEGVLACGQLYPMRKRLDFCITDMGLGIPAVVRRGKGLRLTGSEAIQWAMTGCNTTRIGDVPGGLGLKILKEFITLNRGRLIVVSETGYWEMSGGNMEMRELPVPFPGTAVTIEVNTADSKIYKLKSEIDPTGIF